jgi:hypothetical protein
MLVFLGILAVIIFPTEEMKEFRAHSNGMAEYRFVEAVECETGLNKSGYSVAPSGNIVLKQVNADGTVGNVCIQ